jgi:hypothetical protein
LATALTNTAIDTALWHRGIGVFEEDVDFGVVQWKAPRDNIIAAFRVSYYDNSKILRGKLRG